MSRIFPQIHLATGQDDLRPMMSHAMLHDNKIVATDAHIMIFSDVRAFKCEQIEGIEEHTNKLIGRNTLKEMAMTAVKAISFTDNTIQITRKDGAIIIRYYTGRRVDPDSTRHEFNMHNEFTGEAEGGTMVYPNYEAVIPKIDGAAFPTIGINATLLDKLSKCFTSTEASLKLSFCGGGMSKDYPNRGMIVEPVLGNDKGYERGLTMPVMIV